MSIKKIALLGADGNLGPSVLHGLVAANFQVTVLKRESSKSPSNYPKGVHVAQVPDSFEVDDLTPILKGHEAVVVTIKGSESELQKRIADACVQAGVGHFIPADFGSCDSFSPLTGELVPLYKRKTELREYLVQLAQKHPSFSWTSLVCGHFFDWSLDFIHIYPEKRRADILDDGNTRFSISTLARTAEATVRVLQRPKQTANQMLYVQSFCVTQNAIVHAYEDATRQKWEVKSLDAEKFKDDEKAKLDRGDDGATGELVWYLGTVDADWRTRDGFAMQLLGLEDEDLDTAVKAVLQKTG